MPKCGECRKRKANTFWRASSHPEGGLLLCKICASEMQVRVNSDKQLLQLYQSINKKRYSEAIKKTKAILKLGRGRFAHLWLRREVLSRLGWIYFQKGDFQKAVHYYRLRSQLKFRDRSDYALNQMLWGDSWMELGRLDRALRVYEQGLKDMDQTSTPFALKLLKRIVDAVQQFKKPFNANPIYIEALKKTMSWWNLKKRLPPYPGSLLIGKTIIQCFNEVEKKNWQAPKLTK